MRVLLAIEGCHARADRIRACNHTWANGTTMPPSVTIVRFAGESESPDSIFDIVLPVGDKYLDLPHKTQAIVRYALDKGYDMVWKTDDDCYNQPTKLTDREINAEYWGRENDGWGGYVSGVSYGLGRKAMEVVANSTFQSDDPGMWEDVLVGKWVRQAGIIRTLTDRVILIPKVGGHTRLNLPGLPQDFLGVGELDPKTMFDLHRLVISNKLIGSGKLSLPPRLFYPNFTR